MLENSNRRGSSIQILIDGREKLVHLYYPTFYLPFFPSNPNPIQVLPFSAGARACIGIRFALSESMAILANLVHTFEISLPIDVVLTLKDIEMSSLLPSHRYEVEIRAEC
jgi:hypothetical protein